MLNCFGKKCFRLLFFFSYFASCLLRVNVSFNIERWISTYLSMAHLKFCERKQNTISHHRAPWEPRGRQHKKVLLALGQHVINNLIQEIPEWMVVIFLPPAASDHHQWSPALSDWWCPRAKRSCSSALHLFSLQWWSSSSPPPSAQRDEPPLPHTETGGASWNVVWFGSLSAGPDSKAHRIILIYYL